MKKAYLLLGFTLVWASVNANGQAAPAPETPRGKVLEVTYYRGMPLAYSPIGTNPLYGAFKLIDGWKPKPGEESIEGVSMVSRETNGVITIKVSVVRGQYFDKYELVGEYTMGEKTLVLDGLAKVGIVPFEVRLVPAPATVSMLPDVVNKTTSLIVSVEPATASLPSFKARVINSSNKPVLAVSHKLTMDGRNRNSAMPQNRNGGALIEPGEAYEMVLRYPVKITTESTGELPGTQSGSKLEIDAVIFADGSYEGDPLRAAMFRAGKLGERIQVTRIVELLRSPSAGSLETLSPAAETLRHEIDIVDLRSFAVEFPGLTKTQLEDMRSIAEMHANDFQKEFRSVFGSGTTITAANLESAVKTTLAKCEARLEALP